MYLLSSLLFEPNPNDSLVDYITKDMKNETELFKKNAEQFTQIYALI